MKNNKKLTINSLVNFSDGEYKIVKSENESDYCVGCECPDCQEAIKIIKGCYLFPYNIIFKKNIK